MKQVLLMLLTLSLVSLNVEAGRSHNRERRQQGRIAQGVKSGELTKREAKKLRKGQKHVDKMQEKAMQDGVVTDQEKMRIEKAQDHQSKMIYKQKHDEQQRGDHKNETPAPQPLPPVPAQPATPAQPSGNN